MYRIMYDDWTDLKECYVDNDGNLIEGIPEEDCLTIKFGTRGCKLMGPDGRYLNHSLEMGVTDFAAYLDSILMLCAIQDNAVPCLINFNGKHYLFEMFDVFDGDGSITLVGEIPNNPKLENMLIKISSYLIIASVDERTLSFEVDEYIEGEKHFAITDAFFGEKGEFIQNFRDAVDIIRDIAYNFGVSIDVSRDKGRVADDWYVSFSDISYLAGETALIKPAICPEPFDGWKETWIEPEGYQYLDDKFDSDDYLSGDAEKALKKYAEDERLQAKVKTLIGRGEQFIFAHIDNEYLVGQVLENDVHIESTTKDGFGRLCTEYPDIPRLTKDGFVKGVDGKFASFPTVRDFKEVYEGKKQFLAPREIVRQEGLMYQQVLNHIKEKGQSSDNYDEVFLEVWEDKSNKEKEHVNVTRILF